jgi:hypothetical protein
VGHHGEEFEVEKITRRRKKMVGVLVFSLDVHGILLVS